MGSLPRELLSVSCSFFIQSVEGFTIALTIHSVDPIRSLDCSLFTRLMTCSIAIDGVDGARDGKQNPGAGYSVVVEVTTNFFDKL